MDETDFRFFFFCWLQKMFNIYYFRVKIIYVYNVQQVYSSTTFRSHKIVAQI